MLGRVRSVAQRLTVSGGLVGRREATAARAFGLQSACHRQDRVAKEWAVEADVRGLDEQNVDGVAASAYSVGRRKPPPERHAMLRSGTCPRKRERRGCCAADRANTSSVGGRSGWRRLRAG